jgi:hypothetical protein
LPILTVSGHFAERPLLASVTKCSNIFLRTIPRANGMERASTPPGSLGTSPAASTNLQSAAGEFPDESFFNSYIEVHLMSISGILSSGFLQKQLGAPSTPYQQSIRQLSKDLQSGNLSAAQSDFAALQKAFSPSPISTGAGSAASTSNPVTQAFNQLATDLKSGNLSAAQKDFSALQQDLENLGGPGSINRFHHYHPLKTGNGDLTNSTQSSVLQPQPPVLIGGGPYTEPPVLIGGGPYPGPPVLISGGPYPEPAVSGPPVSTGGLRQPEPPVSGPPISLFA